MKAELQNRLYERDRDYPTAFRWWKAHNAAPIDISYLPSLGLVVESEEKSLAMSWLYLSNSEGAQVGWTVCDPEISPRLKIISIQRVILGVEELAKTFGVKWLMTLSDRSSLTKIMQQDHWKEVRPHTFLVKDIRGKDFETDSI